MRHRPNTQGLKNNPTRSLICRPRHHRKIKTENLKKSLYLMNQKTFPFLMTMMVTIWFVKVYTVMMLTRMHLKHQKMAWHGDVKSWSAKLTSKRGVTLQILRRCHFWCRPLSDSEQRSNWLSSQHQSVLSSRLPRKPRCPTGWKQVLSRKCCEAN